MTHEDKQAFMRKAALDGRSASEIVRRSIADYLEGRNGNRRSSANVWKPAVMIALGVVLLFAHPVAPPATAGLRQASDAMQVLQTFNNSGTAERKMLAEKFAKEIAASRLLILEPNRPGQQHWAFSSLDINSDGRLSLTEYRRLMGVPSGELGRRRLQLLDGNRDGWLSESEFQL